MPPEGYAGYRYLTYMVQKTECIYMFAGMEDSTPEPAAIPGTFSE